MLLVKLYCHTFPLTHYSRPMKVNYWETRLFNNVLIRILSYTLTGHRFWEETVTALAVSPADELEVIFCTISHACILRRRGRKSGAALDPTLKIYRNRYCT